MYTQNEFGQPIGHLVKNWSPRPQPSDVVLEGKYCMVEPLNLDHAESLYNSFLKSPDGRSWTWLFDEAPKNFAEYFSWVENKCQKNDPFFFTILDKNTQAAIGVFALMRIDANNGVIEVGHVHFSPLLSGTIMSTEAHWLLMKYVFEELKYRRYEWKCNSLNEPSRRAAKRLGFQYEGTFRNALVAKGRNRDTDWFSIIDTEWDIVNKTMQQWLSPLNFTDTGRQIKTLLEIRENILR